MGLWIIQECKREWDRRGEVYSYDQMAEMASTAVPFRAFIDPDHDSFYSPGDMPKKIQEFCRDTGQQVPESKDQIIRCVFESLAMKYRWSLEKLEGSLVRGWMFSISWGGAQNKLLNQLITTLFPGRLYAVLLRQPLLAISWFRPWLRRGIQPAKYVKG